MILFCGDTHGGLTHIQREIQRLHPTAIILLGDIEPDLPLQKILSGTDVYFISGNHDGENEDHYNNIFKSDYATNNLNNRVVEIDGLRVAGLGGTFDEKIWMPPSEPIYENYAQWEAANRYNNPYFEKQKRIIEHGAIFYDDYINLMMQKADVLVLHDAPSCHPYGYEALDELAQAMGVKTVFHGDHHDCLDYSLDEARMGFRTYGVGLRGVTDESGLSVRVGDLDKDRFEQRMAKKAQHDQMFGWLPESTSYASRPSF